MRHTNETIYQNMRTKIITLAIVVVAGISAAQAQETKTEQKAPQEKRVADPATPAEAVPLKEKAAAPASKPTQDPAIVKQRAEAQEARRADRSEKLAQDLGLTDEQTSKVKQIDDTYAAAMQELRSSTDRDKTQEGARLAREQREASLKEVLTTEQYQKMHSMREVNRENSMKKESEIKERKAQ